TESRLGEMLGAPVHVGGVNLGLVRGSELRDVQLFANDDSPAPWLTLPRVSLPASVGELLRGTPLGRIEVTGATIDLHFDADGTLRTRLPAPRGAEGGMPEILLHSASVVLRQNGREPLHVRGVEARLSPGERGVVLDGQIDDEAWGRGRIDGRAAADRRDATLTLSTDSRPVTQAMLESLPFVSKKVWQTVRVDGETSAVLTIRHGGGYPPENAIHYRVELE